MAVRVAVAGKKKNQQFFFRFKYNFDFFSELEGKDHCWNGFVYLKCFLLSLLIIMCFSKCLKCSEVNKGSKFFSLFSLQFNKNFFVEIHLNLNNQINIINF